MNFERATRAFLDFARMDVLGGVECGVRESDVSGSAGNGLRVRSPYKSARLRRIVGYGRGHASPGVVDADAVVVWVNRVGQDTRRTSGVGMTHATGRCRGEAMPRPASLMPTRSS